MFKRTIAAVIILVVVFFSCGVGGEAREIGNGNGRAGGSFHESTFSPLPAPSVLIPQEQPVQPTMSVETYKTNDTWLIQRYLCGSDLETKYGSASRDFQEILNVKLTGNVKVLIETGGALGGVCLDERTKHMLSLNDVRNAFTAAYQPAADNQPFELIGFDACLMATYETVILTRT